MQSPVQLQRPAALAARTKAPGEGMLAPTRPDDWRARPARTPKGEGEENCCEEASRPGLAVMDPGVAAARVAGWEEHARL